MEKEVRVRERERETNDPPGGETLLTKDTEMRVGVSPSQKMDSGYVNCCRRRF